jgi:hypothetical protein
MEAPPATVSLLLSVRESYPICGIEELPLFCHYAKLWVVVRRRGDTLAPIKIQTDSGGNTLKLLLLQPLIYLTRQPIVPNGFLHTFESRVVGLFRADLSPMSWPAV